MRETEKFHKWLPEEHHDAWLPGEAGKEVLVPFPAEQMQTWPVSPRANSRKNNDPEIVAPIDRLIPIESALPMAILE